MKKLLVCLGLMLVLLATAACNSQPNATTTDEAQVAGTVNGENIYRYEYDFYLDMYFNEYFSNYYDTLRDYQGVDLLDEESSRVLLGDLEKYAWDSAVQASLIRQMSQQEYNLTIDPSYMDELLVPAYALSIKTNRFYGLLYPLLQEEAKAEVQVSDEEALSTYESDPSVWDCRRVAHIIIMPEDSSEEAKEKALAEAEGIIGQLNAGADFAEMAQQFSQDGSAENGGEMEMYFNINGTGVSETSSFDPLFAAGAFDLAEVGDYSAAPVESSFGYHIIKLSDKREGFDAVKDLILSSMQTLTEEDFSQYFQQKMQSAQDAAEIVCNIEFKYYSEEAAAEEGTDEEATSDDTTGDDATGDEEPKQ